MAKIQRKYLAHYINTSPTGTPSYERLGKDLEELTIELNPEVESKKNILGETSVNLSSYEAQASVAPYYAETGSGLHDFLQDIIDNRKVLDDAKTDAVEVHTWEGGSSGSYTAFKETVVVEISSYGGDTTGYQIPFTMRYLGDRVKGTFDPETKTFTPNT